MACSLRGPMLLASLLVLLLATAPSADASRHIRLNEAVLGPEEAPRDSGAGRRLLDFGHPVPLDDTVAAPTYLPDFRASTPVYDALPDFRASTPVYGASAPTYLPDFRGSTPVYGALPDFRASTPVYGA